MADDLFEFTWPRPANEDGYVWVQQKAVGVQHRARPVLVLGERKGMRTQGYSPLLDEPGLFRTFADTEDTQAGVLAFANRYGLLGCGATLIKCKPAPDELEVVLPHLPGEPEVVLRRPDGSWLPAAEMFEVWRAEIIWLRHLLRLWDLARDENDAGLEPFVWADGGKVTYHLPALTAAIYVPPWHPQPSRDFDPDSLPGFPPGFPRPWRSSWRETGILTWPRDDPRPILADSIQAAAREGDLRQLALRLIQYELSTRLRNGVSAAVYWNGTRQGLEFGVRPGNLLLSMYLQFAWALDGDRQFRRCPVCRRWFELAPGLTRADRLTCSDACRARAYRERQEQARQMHTEGKTVKEIAKALDSEVSTIKKWVANKKG